MAMTNVTPADIAGNVQNPAANIGIAAAPAATPAVDDKYKTINDVYAPTLANQQQQVQGVNDRYAKNTADISNLFGTLTTLREADKVKIQEQFVNTLAAQREQLASRTAEARAGMAAGEQGAAQAAQELGGPATGPITSLQRQAGERGIAQSNALSTIWQNLQASQNTNNLQSVQNQIAGYGGLKGQLSTQLAGQKDAQLMQLAGQQAQIDTQIAKAKADYDQAIAAGQAQAAQEALNRKNALKIAQTRAYASVQAAKIRASTKTEKPTYYGKLDTWYTKNRGKGVDEAASNYYASSMDNVLATLSPATSSTPTLGPNNQVTYGTPTISRSQALKAWVKAETAAAQKGGYPAPDAKAKGIVNDYLTYNGYK